MADLIDRVALLDAMPKNDMLLSFDVRRTILAQPTVGVVEQKPLTLDEAKEQRAVWIEDDGYEYENDLYPAILCAWLSASQRFTANGDNSVWFDNDGYGITWRCWLRKPTDAERYAAPWRENNDEG